MYKYCFESVLNSMYRSGLVDRLATHAEGAWPNSLIQRVPRLYASDTKQYLLNLTYSQVPIKRVGWIFIKYFCLSLCLFLSSLPNKRVYSFMWHPRVLTYRLSIYYRGVNGYLKLGGQVAMWPAAAYPLPPSGAFYSAKNLVGNCPPCCSPLTVFAEPI